MKLFVPIEKPPVQEPTKEQMRQLVPRVVRQSAATNFQRLCAMQRQGIETIWSNPRLTPQEAVDTLGTSAVKVFRAHGHLTELILALAALEEAPETPEILFPTNAFTANEDGTVTVLDAPYVPGV
ncbi:hypothetical protein [Luteolibacter sp. LG18]|uniref:hypothetical protein n=1 Tax=Luteolibacter sp. LG18 TaxID=2819286 RepID=UPI002B299958|nr:hypothetical protein llg_26490 [Luteolibacter sp. LG18]